MYIAPNSTIKLMTIPFDPDYEHTGYFPNIQAQNTYFNSAAGRTFTEQYYTRPYRGYVRLEIPADNAYIYNYMRFQNTAYGNKWFYAFITSVRWINNQVTEFGFKLDVMQTWYFDYQLEKCFVVREHSASDEIGENLVPEGLETGEFMIENMYRCLDTQSGTDIFLNNDIVIISTLDATATLTFPVYTYGKMYNGLHYVVFHNDTIEGVWTTAAEQASRYIGDTMVGYPDAIQGIYMCPHSFIFYDRDSNTGDYAINHYTWEINKGTHWTYTYGNKTGPRNNKLYTHPFNTFVITNNDDVNTTMPYEYFSEREGLVPGHGDGKIRFDVSGVPSPYPQFSLIPYGYKQRDPNSLTRSERIALDNVPMCAYATDTFRAWLAQNKIMMDLSFAESSTNFMINGLTALAPLIGNGADIEAGNFMSAQGYSGHGVDWNTPSPAPNNIGGVVSKYTFDTLKLLGTMEQHRYMPPARHGSGANALAIGNEHFGFIGYAMHVRPEFASIIDDYFDRYGYACHELKVPNTHVRKRWTFTQTIGCSIKPSIYSNGLPGDDASTIQNIYNKGITFWVTPADIGDYSLDNPVLSNG